MHLNDNFNLLLNIYMVISNKLNNICSKAKKHFGTD